MIHAVFWHFVVSSLGLFGHLLEERLIEIVRYEYIIYKRVMALDSCQSVVNIFLAPRTFGT